MARVQFVIPEEDRDRIVRQARKEGLSLSAWLRAAVRERLHRRQPLRSFRFPAEIEEFFRQCDALEGPPSEPDWDKHLAVIGESRGNRA